MTVTDSDDATDDAPPGKINTTLHAPNYTTSTDAVATTVKNNTSARQLLDGQEYPVAKCDNINKGFDCEASIERCVAYLHGLYQLTGCPRYISDRITL